MFIALRVNLIANTVGATCFRLMIRSGSIHHAPTELRDIFFVLNYKHFVPRGLWLLFQRRMRQVLA
jgi:hypothetical protein